MFRFRLFDTAIGRCGVVWSASGIVALQLPERSDGGTRARMLAQFPTAVDSAAPPAVSAASSAIAAHLDGALSDLSSVVLDMERVPPFHRQVYQTARMIAPGTTRSYGELAIMVGSPGAARAVGQALRRNPFPIVVPCHRVLAAGGRLGGFSGGEGIATKIRLLTIEGAHVGRPLALFEPQATRN